MNAGRKATIRDVAAAAGVSPMTVSRTLHGGDNVTDETQQRVWTAVRALGYSRNEIARSLRPGQRSNLVGIAVTEIANPYYGDFVVGAESVLGPLGIRVLLGNTAEDQERERTLLADFAGRQVDGAIVVPAAGVDCAHLGALQDSGLRVVLASRHVEGLDLPSVVLADEAGAHDAVSRLIAMGHRRIGFIGFVESMYTSAHRYLGYLRALTDHGLARDDSLVIPRTLDKEEIAAEVVRLRLLPDPPTAFFSANNRHTMGLYRAALQRPALFGTSFAAAAFDDFDLSDLSPFPVVVVEHDPREMGRTAAELLIDRSAASGPTTLPVTVVLKGAR